MKKLILIFILCNFILQVQIVSNSQTNSNRDYYWFHISVGEKEEGGVSQIYIRNIGSDISSGSFQDFIDIRKSSLQSGSIVIGPFLERYQAQHSQYLYKYKDSPSMVTGKKPDTKDTIDFYNFFYIKPVAENFSKEIELVDVPARVNTGTQEDFAAILSEGLNFKKLLVGPFPKYETAEKSKFVYRKTAITPPQNEIDSAKSRDMRIMEKQWNSIGIKITKKTERKETKEVVYSLSTKFPRKYFAPHATQVITIKPIYSRAFAGKTASVTLQGDRVIDNNYVVSNSTNTYYINHLYFDKCPYARITGFICESFIYNDAELIELDAVVIKL